MPSEPRHTRFPPELSEAIRAHAQDDGVTQADYLRALVRKDMERRARFAADPRHADINLLYFRSAHGDEAAQLQFSIRLAQMVDQEPDIYKRFEIFGIAMAFLRMAAEHGSSEAQCNYASALMVRSEVAREMGDDGLADVLMVDALARYDIAVDGGGADIFALLNAAVSVSRPSMVQAAQAIRDQIVAGVQPERESIGEGGA